jgi:hypothetical protein
MPARSEARTGMSESRYGWLLRMYPEAYRRERGPEMLATLAEAAEAGRTRPARREVAGLVVGALRLRAGALAGGSPGRRWLSALRLAVLFLLAYGTAQSLAQGGRIVQNLLGGHLYPLSNLGYLAATVAGAVALVAVAAGRYRLGFLAALAATVAIQWGLRPWFRELPIYQQFSFRMVFDEFWTFPLAVLVALPLLVRRPAAARQPLLWLLAVPVALLLLPSAFDATVHWQPYGPLAVAAVCLLWTVVDARVAIGAAALLLVTSLPRLMLLGRWPYEAVFLILVVVLAAAGAFGVRQQARL